MCERRKKMKGLKLIVSAFVVLALLCVAGHGWALTTKPTLNYTGITTTSVSGTDVTLTVNGNIDRAIYLDGTSTTANNTEETIVDATLSITGAVADDCTAFPNAVFFSNATMTITGPAPDNHVYMSADLSVVMLDLGNWLLFPAVLDPADPSTLNLSNIVLSSAGHPSRWVDEFVSVLNPLPTKIAGMTMNLTNPPLTGSFCGGGTFNASGVIDGAPEEVVIPPSGARTIGYWKNHDEERNAFIDVAISLSDVFGTPAELEADLTRKGKKGMLLKARQQFAALLLNCAASLDPDAIVLDAGELEILQLIDSMYGTGSTVQDAKNEIEAIITADPPATQDMQENAKDLADEINNRDNQD
jgi:hypothetical protein